MMLAMPWLRHIDRLAVRWLIVIALVVSGVADPRHLRAPRGTPSGRRQPSTTPIRSDSGQSATRSPDPAGTVVPAALKSAFGGPYDDLPSDFRAGIEARVAAISVDNGPLSLEDQVTWRTVMEQDGSVRLDDQTLARRYQLEARAVGRAPVAACAHLARGWANGGTMSMADAVAAALDEQKDWYAIAVEAMEAAANEIPVPRTVTDDGIGAVFTKLDGLATAEELTATHAGEDPTASDAALCVGSSLSNTPSCYDSLPLTLQRMPDTRLYPRPGPRRRRRGVLDRRGQRLAYGRYGLLPAMIRSISVVMCPASALQAAASTVIPSTVGNGLPRTNRFSSL